MHHDDIVGPLKLCHELMQATQLWAGTMEKKRRRSQSNLRR